MDATAIGGASIERSPGGFVLRAQTARGAGLRLTGPFDWSAAAALVFQASSTSGLRVRVTIEHGAAGDGRDARRWVFYFVPKPGLRLRVAVPIADLRIRPANTSRPGYFTFGGGPHPVDLAAVAAIRFEYDQDGPALELGIEALEASAVPVEPAVLDPRPVVDAWGQWTGHGGRPRTEAEIRAAWAAEPAGPGHWPGRSRWGGDGRTGLEATGRFRVDRLASRWTLVDPAGHPFFSVGPDCCQLRADGPVAGREALFADLAQAASGPGRADFFARAITARHGPVRARWAAATADRLRRWGFNTIGNWSAVDLLAATGVPLVTDLRGLGPWCHRVPDVFDPAFAGRVEDAVREQVGRHAGDAALVGYFVGNEPAWTFAGAISPFQTVFAGGHPHTAAAAAAWLRARYGQDVAALGRAWGRDYGTWEAVWRLGPPDPRTGPPALAADAESFVGEILARFYGACCAAVRRLDPGRLLLGPRFYSASMPEPYLRACAVFDVVSFNCYDAGPPTAAIARLEALAGRPVLIGEFHFGVCGRGMSGALRTVADDAARGEAYGAYIAAAAACPAVVGAHWFQWVDEPVTGRFDGEDYNIGLVDVTDVPYPGLVAGVQRVHRELYQRCFG